ncbi:outer membrane biogenesis protein BamB [Thalassoglobus neptunius]|uniref:Outer membrane biogenesis protein BamB n=1 Tax=Thalassoglobus neptunius TaxID=1938619 RepID=A0A5C5X2X4_9PLAN|nr:PQQ-binding-like beta-propeller repeat protein [Thalassoglobus neptunius]TWT57407.1 outer membrane biogenesis protein BamB [Thalassoglobus neptunius]
MKEQTFRFGVLLFVVLQVQAVLAEPIDFANDWPWWRGPNLNSHASSGQNPPTTFNERKNVKWLVEVPGSGHSSPTVVGNRIFLATADTQNQIQGVICFDRKNGKQLWITPIHQGKFPAEIHPKNTHASSTIACNGDFLFTTFFNDRQVNVSCLNVTGDLVWTKSAGAYDPKKYKFGYGASPLLYSDLVIVAAESDQGSYLAAFHQNTGEEAWRIERTQDVSFSSPVVANVAGREQLLISGLFEVSSFNPATGEKLWSVPGTTQATCGTIVWNEDTVFASGGYPKAETIAVKADGSGEVVWRNKRKCYEQSMVIHNGYLYAFADGGILYCWRASDGEEMWKKRLGGDVSSSPVLVNDTIYLANEDGEVFVIRANPDRYEEVSRTRLGTDLFPTPSVVGNQIFYRFGKGIGPRRQEYLICIGE